MSTEIKRTHQQRSDLLCNGYVRTQSSMEIPLEIIGIMIMFHFEKFQFSTDNYGECLKFLNDTTVTIDNNIICTWSMCIFGTQITRDMCSIFEISFKWKQMSPSTEYHSIAMGFVSTPEIKSWYYRLGQALTVIMIMFVLKHMTTLRALIIIVVIGKRT